MSQSSSAATVTAPPLSPSDIATFAREGYAVVREAFPREVAAQIVPLCYAASTFKADDRSTWQSRAVVPKNLTGPLFSAIYSPRLISAMDQLLGAGRYNLPDSSGYLLFNFPGFYTPPWEMIGGHIDGSHFHHHVHSREQGLIMLFLFTDAPREGGGTAVCPGTHIPMARALAAAEPEGMTSGVTCEHGHRVAKGVKPIELVARAGDVLLMHPFLYHGSSSNLSPFPRIASNMCVFLKEHMNLKRENPADYSVVERVIVDALAAKA
ncbi:MAG: phytanoyl-CoA dioxygenase family protein [Planctomycetota bacterium]|nr:phytanoyl-CoA dioxygenase family protein [Planctomycetota bacterium]